MGCRRTAGHPHSELGADVARGCHKGPLLMGVDVCAKPDHEMGRRSVQTGPPGSDAGPGLCHQSGPMQRFGRHVCAKPDHGQVQG
jgi:hypothetical protein